MKRFRLYINKHRTFVAFLILYLGFIGMFGLYVGQQNEQDAFTRQQTVEQERQRDLEVWQMCDRGNETRAIIQESFQNQKDFSERMTNLFIPDRDAIPPAFRNLIEENLSGQQELIDQLGPRDCGPRP